MIKMKKIILATVLVNSMNIGFSSGLNQIGGISNGSFPPPSLSLES